MSRSPVRSVIGLLFVAAVLLFAWGVSGCAQPRACRGLVNTRVTFDGAPGYTAGSVHSGRVYFHPQAPARDERHFHILVPCERLRVAP